MGIDANLAFEVAGSVQRWSLTGAICTLGVVTVNSAPDQVDDAIRSAGIDPVPTGADPFLRMGFRSVESLDISRAEGCTHLIDLNSVPLPEFLRARFDLVYDGGTLEHVFDVKAALRNIFDMLRIGGAVIHCAPINGWVDHGLYQFSPTLFTDYYLANGFELLDGRLIRYGQPRDVVEVRPYLPGCLDAVRDGSLSGSWLYYGVVRKTATSTGDRVPLQHRYAQAGGSGAATAPGVSRLRPFLPYRVHAGRPEEEPLLKRRLTEWRHGEGRELLAHLPQWAELSDRLDGRLSPLLLLEDEHVIGPPHSLHDKIRALGEGRYSHWGEWLHFSPSVDDRPDAHVYEYAIPAACCREQTAAAASARAHRHGNFLNWAWSRVRGRRISDVFGRDEKPER
jgi:hypothetical protein